MALGEPHCAALVEPYCSALVEPPCSALSVDISIRNAAGSYGASNGMGADCCRLLQRLTDGQERWYVRARNRLSADRCAQSLPFDKPGLSFCCGSGTDKPIRLCVANPALNHHNG
jgi:hypothetical protein